MLNWGHAISGSNDDTYNIQNLINAFWRLQKLDPASKNHFKTCGMWIFLMIYFDDYISKQKFGNEFASEW